MLEKNNFWRMFNILSSIFLIVLFFAIPIEHKYDKLFRFYSLTLIPANLELAKNFDPKIFFYISDVIGLIFFAIGIRQIRKKYQEKGSLCLAAIFLLAMISIAASPFVRLPIAYIHLLQFFTPLSLFFFLAHSSIAKEKLFQIWTKAIFFASLFQSFVAIRQYFSQRSLGLRLIGEQSLGASISVPNGHRWIGDFWSGKIASTEIVYRAMGTMPHPNVLGGFLFVGLLITSYFFFQKKETQPRVWLAAAYLIQLFALGTTYSRSAIFAYIIATTIWLTWMHWRQKMNIRPLAWLATISCAFVFTLLSEQILHRGGLVNRSQLSIASDQVRGFYQDIAFRMIEKHPFLGVGFHQFTDRAPEFLPPNADPSQASSAVHNIYLFLAAEMGLIALAIFLVWIGILLRSAWKSLEYKAETGILLSCFIGFLFIGGCDFYPIFFQQGTLLFFGIAGMLARFGSSEWLSFRNQG